MQVGDACSVGALQGTITAITTVGPETLVQVSLQLEFSGWYPAEIVQDPPAEHADAAKAAAPHPANVPAPSGPVPKPPPGPQPKKP